MSFVYIFCSKKVNKYYAGACIDLERIPFLSFAIGYCNTAHIIIW